MRSELDTRLSEAKAKVLQKQKLAAMIAVTEEQLREIQARTKVFEDRLKKEQRDVAALEGLSFVALFHTILGTKEFRLEEERQEFLSAKLRFDEAVAGRSQVEQQIDNLQVAFNLLASADTDYEGLLEEKHQILLSGSDAKTTFLLGVVERMSEMTTAQRELSEAIAAGEGALQALNQVLVELRAAEDWGWYDMWSKSGFLTTMAKHSRIDAAIAYSQVAQRRLRQFDTELADVGRELGVTLRFDAFTIFADYFFDGLISDWVAQSKIENSIRACAAAISKVQTAISKCRSRRREIEQELTDITEQRRKFIEES